MGRLTSVRGSGDWHEDLVKTGDIRKVVSPLHLGSPEDHGVVAYAVLGLLTAPV